MNGQFRYALVGMSEMLLASAVLGGCGTESQEEVSAPTITGAEESQAVEDMPLKVNVGGLTGAQHYMTAEENTINTKLQSVCELDPEAGQLNIGRVCGSIDFWYEFEDQLLIYAQRPNARACADMGTWNKKMFCWETVVQKGLRFLTGRASVQGLDMF